MPSVLSRATWLVAASLVAVEPTWFTGLKASLSPIERRTLTSGRVVAKTLPAADGQVSVFASVLVDADAATLATEARSIAELKRSSFVKAIRRFSEPPALSDLDGLTLPARDVSGLAACAVHDCALKLSEPEIRLLQSLVDRSPASIQQAFRQIVLNRVNAYRAGGLSALPPIANRPASVSQAAVFESLVQEPRLVPQTPVVERWLRHFPAADSGGIESFLYWSQESYGPGKPIVIVNHVGIARVDNDSQTVIVIGKQVLATRYLDGALALTAITGEPGSRDRYLTYVNRSRVDLLGGFLAPLKRSILESRLKREMPEILLKLRTRLERRAAAPPTR